MWFNLSEDEAFKSREKNVHCLIIYDIVDNKRRKELSDLLIGYGQRVQRSCFECIIEPKIYQSVIDQLEEFYDADEMDNIIVYRFRSDEITRLSYVEIKEKKDILFF